MRRFFNPRLKYRDFFCERYTSPNLFLELIKILQKCENFFPSIINAA